MASPSGPSRKRPYPYSHRRNSSAPNFFAPGSNFNSSFLALTEAVSSARPVTSAGSVTPEKKRFRFGSASTTRVEEGGEAAARADTMASQTGRSAAECSPPDELERYNYYRGPIVLIFRSSTFDWKAECHDPWPKCRLIGPMGGHHDIAKQWNDPSSTLWRDIKSKLNPSPVQVASLVQTSRENESSRDTNYVTQQVLLLRSPLESTSWEQARDVALGCKEVLCAHGFPDVEVEVASGQVKELARLNSDRVPNEHPRDAMDFRYNTEFIGTAIMSETPDLCEGTKGPYLRLVKGQDVHTVALTCRHVIKDSHLLKENQDYKYTPDQEKIIIVQPPDASLRKDKKYLEQKISRTRNQAKRMRKNIETAHKAACDAEEQDIRKSEADDVEEKLEALKQKRVKIPDCPKADELTSRVFELQRKLAMVQDFLTRRESRAIGHVLASAPRDFVMWHGKKFIRDWALIALDQSVHSTSLSDLKSKVIIGAEGYFEISSSLDDEEGSEGSEGSEEETNIGLDFQTETAVPRPGRPIPLDEIQAKLADAEHRPRRPETNTPEGLVVGKFGKRTWLTFGVVSGVETKERCNKDGPEGQEEGWVTEIVVTGLGKRYDEDEQHYKPFSGKGDSGSGVWSCQSGEWVGMITSGIEAEGKDYFDSTFCSPMQFLLDDIKAYLDLDDIEIL